MGELERAYIDSAGQVWKKGTDSIGRKYYRKDGLPVSQNAFNGGLANRESDGQPAKVAIPSNKGPGYERIRVSQKEASQLGQELNLTREEARGTPKDRVTLGGETYNTYELAELNQRIISRWGSDSVMKY